MNRFDWLPSGGQLQVDGKSQLVLVFSNGQRYSLGEHARVLLTPRGLTPLAGPVQRLTAVPPLPALESITGGGNQRAGAVRLRLGAEGPVQRLYPGRGASSIAETTTLRFAPVAGASLYQVELENEDGKTLFAIGTTAAEVVVPAGTLEPGHLYYWEVKALRGRAILQRGEAEFGTLTAAQSRARENLKSSLTGHIEMEEWALLAAVDQQLGLWAEAHQELATARSRFPEEPSLRSLQQLVERQLWDGSTALDAQPSAESRQPE